MKTDRFLLYFEPRGAGGKRSEHRFELGTIDKYSDERVSRHDEGIGFASIPLAMFWRILDRYGSTKQWSPEWALRMSAELKKYGWTMRSDLSLEHQLCTIELVSV